MSEQLGASDSQLACKLHVPGGMTVVEGRDGPLIIQLNLTEEEYFQVVRI